MTRLLQSIVVEPHISEGPRRERIRKIVHTADNFLLEEQGALIEAHHGRIITIGTQSLGNLAKDLNKSNEETPVADGSKVIYSSLEKGLFDCGGFGEPPASNGSSDSDHDDMPKYLVRPIIGHHQQNLYRNLCIVTKIYHLSIMHGIMKSHECKAIVNTTNQRQKLEEECHPHQTKIIPHTSEGRGKIGRCKGNTIPNHKHVPHREHQRYNPSNRHKTLGTNANPNRSPRERHPNRENQRHVHEAPRHSHHERKRQRRNDNRKGTARIRHLDNVLVRQDYLLVETELIEHFVIFHPLARAQLLGRFNECLGTEFETDNAHDHELSDKEDAEEDVLEGLGLFLALDRLHIEIHRVLTHVRFGATRALEGGPIPSHLLRQESIRLPSQISTAVHSHIRPTMVRIMGMV
mmetsp:Transcript_23682/g.42363  ORF Transcript_23682/g.42363 Transcript_23682/m.42363 type:complete len:406 (+) Transcript_23682:743-1960(+)